MKVCNCIDFRKNITKISKLLKEERVTSVNYCPWCRRQLVRASPYPEGSSSGTNVKLYKNFAVVYD